MKCNLNKFYHNLTVSIEPAPAQGSDLPCLISSHKIRHVLFCPLKKKSKEIYTCVKYQELFLQDKLKWRFRRYIAFGRYNYNSVACFHEILLCRHHNLSPWNIKDKTQLTYRRNKLNRLPMLRLVVFPAVTWAVSTFCHASRSRKVDRILC